MNTVLSLIAVSAAVLAQQPEPFFGQPEAVPVSGPVIGRELSSGFGARQVTGKYLNPSSALE